MRVLPAVSCRVGLISLVGLLALGTTSARAQQGALRGVVRDSAGAPIRDADVGIVTLRRLTRTDEHGRFALTKLPPGNVDLSVRRLSYEPHHRSVLVVAGSQDSLRVTLIAIPALLNPVNVTKGEIRQRENIEDFYRRMTGGLGQYVGREEIEKRWGGNPSDMIRTIPGVRLVRTATGGYGVRFPNTSLGRSDCAPMIWIDGQKAPGLEIDGLTLGDLEGIELYKGPSTTPLQFSQGQGSNNCGTIVMWSRPPQYQKTARYREKDRERKP